MKLRRRNLVMANLNNFIHVYEHALNQKQCESLIDIFENNQKYQERVQKNYNRPSFTQVNLTSNLGSLGDDVKSLHDSIVKTVIEYRDIYYRTILSNSLDSNNPMNKVFPLEHSLEQFRIKKYNNDGKDLFDTHVDIMDYESARRYVSFMFYLNDVESGGKTVFGDFEYQPKQGNLLVFPPLWMFPHRGEPPISNSKYIMSTYLHYK
jgi:prolyl 4-hydroxylase